MTETEQQTQTANEERKELTYLNSVDCPHCGRQLPVQVDIGGGYEDFMTIEGSSIGNLPWPNIAISLSVNTGELYQHVAEKQKEGLVVVLDGCTAMKLRRIRENGYCGENANRIINSALDLLQREIEEWEREKELTKAQASTV